VRVVKGKGEIVCRNAEAVPGEFLNLNGSEFQTSDPINVPAVCLRG
jgi:hypothetical protein